MKRNETILRTWKGVKFLISLKIVASSAPTVPSLDNGNTIPNHHDIANIFNPLNAKGSKNHQISEIFEIFDGTTQIERSSYEESG